MNRTSASLVLLLSFFLVADSFSQIFVNFRNAGSFSATEFSSFGLTASAKSGVTLSQLNGIAVTAGHPALIEVGETLEVQLPFAAENVRLDSFPTTSNFTFGYEAFSDETSLGVISWNFIGDNELDLAAEIGQTLDAFTMTGIGGPTDGDNLAYVTFSAPPLVNFGFEDGKAGSFAPGWIAINNALTSNAAAFTGSNSVQLIVPVGQDFASSEVQQTFAGVVEGMFVQGSAFALNPSSDPITGENFARVVLDFLDDNGDPIDVNSSPTETGVLSEIISVATPLDEFVLLNTGYFQAPAGTQSARISLQHTQSPNPNNEGTGSVFFDDASLELNTFPIKRTLPTLGEEFSITDSQQLNSEPPLLYEIIHDGVGQILIDTVGTDVNSRLVLYNDAGRVVATAGGTPDDPGQLFFDSIPAGRYVLMFGRSGMSVFPFFYDIEMQLGSFGNFVVTVSSDDPVPQTPDVVGTFMAFGFDYFDQDFQDPEDDGSAIFYEVIYDGIAPLTLVADDLSGHPATLGFYDEIGNLLSTGSDGLVLDTLDAGIYFLGVGNRFTDFMPEFEWISEPFTFGPVITEVSTGTLGDINCDGVVSLLDVAPFVDIVSSGIYVAKADINQDGNVDLLDINPFIELLTGG